MKTIHFYRVLFEVVMFQRKAGYPDSLHLIKRMTLFPEYVPRISVAGIFS